MQLREFRLSNVPGALLRELVLFVNGIREFNWTRQGLNDYLLNKSLRLFDVKMYQKSMANHSKSKRKMRSLKRQQKIKKQWFKSFLKQRFGRKIKRKNRKELYRNSRISASFSRNVMRN